MNIDDNLAELRRRAEAKMQRKAREAGEERAKHAEERKLRELRAASWERVVIPAIEVAFIELARRLDDAGYQFSLADPEVRPEFQRKRLNVELPAGEGSLAVFFEHIEGELVGFSQRAQARSVVVKCSLTSVSSDQLLTDIVTFLLTLDE